MADHGAATLSQCPTTADLRRWRQVRLWKIELQSLANELDIDITVCDLPPGTSKWNKIEHRLFSFITQNWRGRPLVSYQTIVQLIAATTTKVGLTVRSELDTNAYPKAIKVADADIDALNLHRHDFHGDWNYTIKPQPNMVRQFINKRLACRWEQFLF